MVPKQPLLCFNYDSTVCHSFDGNDFKAAASSNHPHQLTSLGKIESGLVAIGCWIFRNEVELYTNGHWVQQPPFPEDIFGYSTATYENVLYVFGGPRWTGDNFVDSQSVWLGRMTKLGLEWSKGPDLLLSRGAHRSIVSGNRFYHIGGRGNMKIEKWTIKANETTKELLDLELDNYKWYPEIFLVNDDFCQ